MNTVLLFSGIIILISLYKLLIFIQFKHKEPFPPQANLEQLVFEEKNKAQRLQTELDVSEQVQRDFVKLSQTLQVRESNQCVRATLVSLFLQTCVKKRNSSYKFSYVGIYFRIC